MVLTPLALIHRSRGLATRPSHPGSGWKWSLVSLPTKYVFRLSFESFVFYLSEFSLPYEYFEATGLKALQRSGRSLIVSFFRDTLRLLYWRAERAHLK